jgi:hypothetical protein
MTTSPPPEELAEVERRKLERVSALREQIRSLEDEIADSAHLHDEPKP